MPLWKRILSALAPRRSVKTVRSESDSLPELARRLAALEDVQTRRELEWAETKSALDRMLKRAAALDQRARERQELAEGTNGTRRQNREQLRELLKAKGLLREG